MTITIKRDLTGAMRHTVQVRGHEFAVDATVPEGGADDGPSPHDLFDAALGACKALTVLWYAQRKAIPVEGIEVAVERDASEERKGSYKLSAALTLGGALTEQQRQDLLAVAQKCPVHKLMTTTTVDITTTLAAP
jgi:putative redox protein